MSTSRMCTGWLWRAILWSALAVGEGPITLSGTVTDGDGLGVPLASISCNDWDHYTNESTIYGTANREGRFAVTVPGPGRYKLYTYVSMADGDSDERRASVMVTVPEDGSVQPIALRIAGRVWGQLAGTLRAPDGSPIPDSPIRISGTQSVGWYEARSNEEGRFLFFGLDPDAGVTLEAHVPGVGYVRATKVAVGQLDYALQLLPPGSVRGRVCDYRGVPMPSFEVAYLPNQSTASDVVLRRYGNYSSFDDAEGAYQIDGITAPQITVLARGPGFAPKAVVVDVVHGDAVDVPTFLLPVAGRIMGMVTYPDGRAAEGAVLSFTGASRYEKVVPVAQAVSDASGRYLIDNAPEGMHGLNVWMDGFMTHSHEVDVRAGNAATVDFELIPWASLEVAVHGLAADRKSGVLYDLIEVTPGPWASPGLQQNIADWNGFGVSLVDGHGEISEMYPGRYWVSAWVDEPENVTRQEVTLAPGEHQHIAFDFDVPRSNVTFVVSHSGKAVMDRVECSMYTEDESGRTYFSSDPRVESVGSVTFSGVAAGRGWVRLRSYGSERRQFQRYFEIPGGADLTLRFDTEHMGDLTCTLPAEKVAAASSVFVLLGAVEDPVSAMKDTANIARLYPFRGRGQVTISGIEAQVYTVLLWGNDDTALDWKMVEVTAGTEVVVDF